MKYFVIDENEPESQGYERDSLEEATELLRELQKNYSGRWIIASSCLRKDPLFPLDEYRMD